MASRMVALCSLHSSTNVVKRLTKDQLAEASKMGPAFFKEGALPGSFVRDIFVKKWSSLMDLNMGVVLGLFRDDVLIGAFGFIIAEDLNDGDLVANECFWFVTPEARGRGFELLIAYEEEAKKMGAVRCSMIHLQKLQPEKLSQIYEKRGYQQVETSYFKILQTKK